MCCGLQELYFSRNVQSCPISTIIPIMFMDTGTFIPVHPWLWVRRDEIAQNVNNHGSTYSCKPAIFSWVNGKSGGKWKNNDHYIMTNIYTCIFMKRGRVSKTCRYHHEDQNWQAPLIRHVNKAHPMHLLGGAHLGSPDQEHSHSHYNTSHEYH